jgi:hypothetical protein
MRLLTGLLFAALVLAGPNAAQAQPAGACLLVCFPPAHLNTKKCACEEATSRTPVCSLACLDPDTTLDARKCACVRRPH